MEIHIEHIEAAKVSIIGVRAPEAGSINWPLGSDLLLVAC